ncbi:MAG: hypothetical protein LAT62_16205, partial [Natronospirillum sp.]|uniref:hypothetical protein n=1 Tax=Natronospirillum sp. TaxID=2812955 RepID=UPI0025DA2211
QVVGRRFWDQCLKVSSLRNPWDMLVSQYEWERSGRAGRSAPAEQPWSQWLDEALSKPGGNGISKAESKIVPHAFINGHFVLDHMILFEDLDGTINDLQARTGVSMPAFSTRNINEKQTRRERDYRRYYAPQEAARVGQVFAPLLARFPYDFDSPGKPPIVK